jgi:hypothetical protein
MKTTQENNRIIAKFMGWEEQTDPTERWFGSFRDNNGILHKNTNTEPLLFHSSWDWLVLVLARIKETKRNGNNLYNHLMNTTISMMINNGIEATYRAVVQFIEWWNEQNAAKEKR